MTLQVSEMALICQHGFKIVAEYKLFRKEWDGSWTVRVAKCLQKGNNCIIRLSHGRKQYTLTYDTKDEANKKILQLIKMGYKKQ